jgi:GTP-binding protein
MFLRWGDWQGPMRGTFDWLARRGPHGRDDNLRALQPSGTRHAVRSAGTRVYEGMIVGENARAVDLDVNAIKEKKLTNMRASTADEAMRLVPPKELSLEQALEFIATTSWWKSRRETIRLRKRSASGEQRPKKKNLRF